MICQFCVDDSGSNFSKTEVLETRMYWDPNDEIYYNERRRQCLACETRFATVERMVEDD
jgi:transcriptional regulator NrdR family protein